MVRAAVRKFSLCARGDGVAGAPARVPALSLLLARRLLLDQRAARFQRVRLIGSFVGPPPRHSREPHRDARLVAGGALDPLEGQLEHELGPYGANRAELLERIP